MLHRTKQARRRRTHTVLPHLHEKLCLFSRELLIPINATELYT